MNKDNNSLEKLDFEFEALESCPLCDGKVMTPAARINWLNTDFWYVTCPSCGLKFMNPRPTRESYLKFYADQFWQQKVRNMGFHQIGQVWQTGKYKEDNEEKWDPEFGRKNLSDKLKRLRIDMITNTLKENVELGKDTNILEVGCSFPVTLEALNENFGCNVHAIEPSEEARAVIESGGKVKLIGRYAEELEDMKDKDLKFDVIIFSHVLENTVDPFTVVQNAAQLLKDGGVIYIQTPNLLVCDQMNPYHPYIFCRNTVKLMAEKAGLKFKQDSKNIDRMLTAICQK